MRHRSLSMALILIAVTGLLNGCQSVHFTDAPGLSGSPPMRFAAVRTLDTRTTGRGEAGSTYHFHPAMEVTSAAEQGSTLRFR